MPSPGGHVTLARMEACTEYSKKLLRTFRSTRRQLPSPEEEGFTNSARFRAEPVSNMRTGSRPLSSIQFLPGAVSELPSSRFPLPWWSSPDPRGVPPRARFKLSSKQCYSWASVLPRRQRAGVTHFTHRRYHLAIISISRTRASIRTHTPPHRIQTHNKHWALGNLTPWRAGASIKWAGNLEQTGNAQTDRK
jgi:hypothetical protein